MKTIIRQLKRAALLLSVVSSMLMTNLAWSISLTDAKTQGLIGEKNNGYIAAISSNPTAELSELVENTNSGRREVYQGLAKKNSISVQQVGILSFEKLSDKAEVGEYLQSANGQWRKK